MTQEMMEASQQTAALKRAVRRNAALIAATLPRETQALLIDTEQKINRAESDLRELKFEAEQALRVAVRKS